MKIPRSQPEALAAVRDCLGELARYPDGNGFELKAACRPI